MKYNTKQRKMWVKDFTDISRKCIGMDNKYMKNVLNNIIN